MRRPLLWATVDSSRSQRRRRIPGHPAPCLFRVIAFFVCCLTAGVVATGAGVGVVLAATLGLRGWAGVAVWAAAGVVVAVASGWFLGGRTELLSGSGPAR